MPSLSVSVGRVPPAIDPYPLLGRPVSVWLMYRPPAGPTLPAPPPVVPMPRVMTWLMISASIGSRGNGPAWEIATRAAEGASSAAVAVVSGDQGPGSTVPSPWYQ